MMPSPAQMRSATQSRAYKTFVVVYSVLTLLGLFRGDSWQQTVGYFLVLNAAALPALLWLRLGAQGIPVWPAVALAYIPYFAWPLLIGTENTQGYSLQELLWAGFTVALFLLTAAMAWRLIAGRSRERQDFEDDRFEPKRVKAFIYSGLVVGILFQAALVFGWLGFVGSFFGAIRTVAITFVVVACFLAGAAKAQGILRGGTWVTVLFGLSLLTLIAWSSLFLVGGIIYLLSTGLGYVLASKRLPLLAFGVLFVAVSILHAGKGEMREKYWLTGTNYGEISAAQLPGMLLEWVGDGVYAIASGNPNAGVVDRASLIQMVLLAETLTPDSIPYLGGETYAMLPSILVPRFIESDKPASQVGMELLNIRYGVLTAEGAAVTAVGWGVVAEAYANFGVAGIVSMAIILGAFCGGLHVWSANARLISIPMLTSIAAMMVLANVEADFIQLFISLVQSFIAVLVFSLGYRWLALPGGGDEYSREELSAVLPRAHEIDRRR